MDVKCTLLSFTINVLGFRLDPFITPKTKNDDAKFYVVFSRIWKEPSVLLAQQAAIFASVEFC